VIGRVAGVFHFPPSELWEFTLDELEFWLDRAEEFCKNG